MIRTMKARIICIVALPMGLALYFMVGSIVAKYTTMSEMDDLLILSQLTVRASALVHETQKERGATGVFMGSGGVKFADELIDQRKNTDIEKATLLALLKSIKPESYGKEFSNTLRAALQKLALIDAHRQQVSSQSISDKQGLILYTEFNNLMIKVVHLISKSSTNAEIGRAGASYANFMEGKERAGIERAVLSITFAANRFKEGVLRKFSMLVSEQDAYFKVFHTLATPEQIVFFEEKMSNQVVAEVQRMRDIAFDIGEGKTKGFEVDVSHWFTTMTKKINIMKEIDDKLADDLQKRAAALQFDAINELITLVALALVILCVVVVALTFIIRGVLKQLGADPSTVAAVVEKVANGELTVEFDTRDKEPTGVFAAMQHMVGNLRIIMQDLNHTALTLAASASEMDNVSTKMSSEAERMSTQAETAATASEHITTNVNTVASAAEQSNVSVTGIASMTEEMSSTFQNVSASARQTAETTKEIASSCEEISSGISTIASAIEEMNSSLHEVSRNTSKASEVSAAARRQSAIIANTMKGMFEASRRIEKVVKVIKGIADQTNMLALNAAIEAAGAGEAGKGFAIVAGEVKELARQSANATDEIAGQIEHIQKNTDDAVVGVQAIDEVINEVAGINETIAASVKEQTATAGEISKTIASNARQVSIVSKNARESAAFVDSIAHSIDESSTTAGEAVRYIAELSQEIKKVARSSADAALGVQDVSINVRKISTAAKQTSTGAKRTSESSGELARMSQKLKDIVGQFKI